MPRLTWNDKLTIEKMLKQGYKAPAIARYIGCSDQAVYDEMKRGQVEILNTDLRTIKVYSPETSMAWHEDKKKNMEQPLKIGNDRAMAEWIIHMIADEKWSPSAVCAVMGTTPETTFSCTICRQTLYKYIEKGYLWPLTNKDLRFKRKKRRYKKVKSAAARASKGKSIERRPKKIDERNEIGHWEMDCVCGKNGCRKVLLVLTERVTRKEIIMPMRDQTASSVVRALDRLERKYGKRRFREIFKTITVDNGSEFMDCQGIEHSCLDGRKRTQVYYCHPRFPGERGSNEKQNQMIRWWFPKGTDFTYITTRQIEKAAEWLNSYPRKILGWRTSDDLFNEFLASVG